MGIEKVVGYKETEVDSEMVFCKLYAFKEILSPFLRHLNNDGAYRKDVIDKVVFGLDLIFSDILTELDQTVYDGIMEKPDEDKEKKLG